MKDTDKIFCRILMDVMTQHGVKDVVCSPGTRNTPLLLAVASRPELRPHVVIDERSAAFMALGISSVSRKPVMLICTSGTALLDYAPAVAEAFYQSVPLIVVSADRPAQWIDQD
ncbi:MAG: 2-succinyl-5-enolpyruvyl-6-hydroxy-3-cyclohexene-1-carboxylic-acid synthase, partial [Muribaculaceae bacterium]|nr:2-succinyl-5-enolpyruvyl-6-hydroxy-3-cyclohexene-1-carboxylic-acid synthase [Muribaculaceae bacterium]